MGGTLLRNQFDGRQEAHVEHAVGLIEDEVADLIQADELAVEEVAEPAGRGIDHPGAGGIARNWLFHSPATTVAARTPMPLVSFWSASPSGCELAGGGEHNRFHLAVTRLGQHGFDHGQEESESFAGSGLAVATTSGRPGRWMVWAEPAWHCKALADQIFLQTARERV